MANNYFIDFFVKKKLIQVRDVICFLWLFMYIFLRSVKLVLQNTETIDGHIKFHIPADMNLVPSHENDNSLVLYILRLYLPL